MAIVKLRECKFERLNDFNFRLLITNVPYSRRKLGSKN